MDGPAAERGQREHHRDGDGLGEQEPAVGRPGRRGKGADPPPGQTGRDDPPGDDVAAWGEGGGHVGGDPVAVAPGVVRGARIDATFRVAPEFPAGWSGTVNGVDDLTRLALAAAKGDRGALHRFVRATQTDVWRLCAHLGDRERADDLTQETYLRALRALPAFRADASARTWLLAITRRTVADALRNSGRRRRMEGSLRPAPDQAPPDDGIALREAVDRLDPDRRIAFVLTQMLGLSYAEAAEVCRCPVGTIRSRLARARADLVDALGGDVTAAL